MISYFRLHEARIVLATFIVTLGACTQKIERPALTGGTNKSMTKNDSPTGADSEMQTGPGIPSPVAVPANPVAQAPVPAPQPDGSARKFDISDGKSLKLGSKALEQCKDDGNADASGIGTYLNVEVLEDNTALSVSVASLCGNLSKDNVVSILRAGDGSVVATQALPLKEIKDKTVLIQQPGLAKGKYTIAIEAGGTTLKTLQSFVVGGIQIESEKNIRFEGNSAF